MTYYRNGTFTVSEPPDTIKEHGYVEKNEGDFEAAFDEVGPGYFNAVGISLLLGRDVGLQDTDAAPKVVVINENMAKFYFGSSNPIGRKFTVDDPDFKGQEMEIVGVARDARDHELKGDVRRRFYVPAVQSPRTVPGIVFEIRTVGNPAAVAEAARKEIKSMAENVPIYAVRTLNSLTEGTIQDEILIARLSSFFAGLALLLASIGLY